jgi:hypothetical protein
VTVVHALAHVVCWFLFPPEVCGLVADLVGWADLNRPR